MFNHFMFQLIETDFSTTVWFKTNTQRNKTFLRVILYLFRISLNKVLNILMRIIVLYIAFNAYLFVIIIGKFKCKSVVCGISSVTWMKYLTVIIGHLIESGMSSGIISEILFSLVTPAFTVEPIDASVIIVSVVLCLSPVINICVWYKVALGVTLTVDEFSTMHWTSSDSPLKE